MLGTRQSPVIDFVRNDTSSDVHLFKTATSSPAQRMGRYSRSENYAANMLKPETSPPLIYWSSKALRVRLRCATVITLLAGVLIGHLVFVTRLVCDTLVIIGVLPFQGLLARVFVRNALATVLVRILLTTLFICRRCLGESL